MQLNGRQAIEAGRKSSLQYDLGIFMGIWMGKADPANNMAELKTEDSRINLYIPELIDELKSLDAEREEAALVPDPQFPLVLMAGGHIIPSCATPSETRGNVSPAAWRLYKEL